MIDARRSARDCLWDMNMPHRNWWISTSYWNWTASLIINVLKTNIIMKNFSWPEICICTANSYGAAPHFRLRRYDWFWPPSKIITIIFSEGIRRFPMPNLVLKTIIMIKKVYRLKICIFMAPSRGLHFWPISSISALCLHSITIKKVIMMI